MSDLVARLRRNRWCDATTGKFTSPPAYDLAGIEAERLDAAAEIERLRTQRHEMQQRLDAIARHPDTPYLIAQYVKTSADLATENERLRALQNGLTSAELAKIEDDMKHGRSLLGAVNAVLAKRVFEPPTKPYSRDCLAREVPGGICQRPNCDC